MATRSGIEWTESTWNPLTGCSKVSPGCKHCYAERMAIRLKAMGHPNYVNGFELTIHDHVLELPLRWKKPQIIFVNSMSDLFHIGLTQFTFPEAKFGVSCLDYIAFFDLNPTSGKVLQAQLRKS